MGLAYRLWLRLGLIIIIIIIIIIRSGPRGRWPGKVVNVLHSDIHRLDGERTAMSDLVVLGKQVAATSSGPRGAQSSAHNASVEMASVSVGR